jgi:acetolactate decarboxylase
MKNNKLFRVLMGITLFLFTSCALTAQQNSNNITIVGAMKNVMWKGQLYGTINLDTIADKNNLYSLGPVEYLSGELLIVNGKAYKSIAVTDSTMKVEETYNVKAPFFGYTNIKSWEEQLLPDSIQTIPQFEAYLNQITKNSNRPFVFRLEGIIEKATIHIVNLPKDSKVSSPDDAHQGHKNYHIQNEQVEIIGFFSTEHKAIFTHHDTFLHMHLITADKAKMGHLDEVLFKNGIKLYLPVN